MTMAGNIMRLRHNVKVGTGFTKPRANPKDNVNPILTECGVMQPTCTRALGYRKCAKTNLNLMIYLLIS